MGSSFTTCCFRKIYGKVELEVEREGQSKIRCMLCDCEVSGLNPGTVNYRFTSKIKYKRHYELIRALLMEMIYIHLKTLNQIGQTGQFSSL